MGGCCNKWITGWPFLNDCKYGYDIKGNQLRLSLLKGATYPDPQARSWFPHAYLQPISASRRFCNWSGDGRILGDQCTIESLQTEMARIPLEIEADESFDNRRIEVSGISKRVDFAFAMTI